MENVTLSKLLSEVVVLTVKREYKIAGSILKHLKEINIRKALAHHQEDISQGAMIKDIRIATFNH